MALITHCPSCDEPHDTTGLPPRMLQVCHKCGSLFEVEPEKTESAVRFAEQPDFRDTVYDEPAVEPSEIPVSDDPTVIFADPQEVIRQAMPGATGQDKYQLVANIARGGMGQILLAYDRDIRREVALKALGEHAGPDDIARFMEEAQITGQLEHPNIVPIHELGMDEDGKPFFTMKMVRGKSLAEVIDNLIVEHRPTQRNWTTARLLQAFVGVLNALEFAHSRGVIHRDLKPDNIMLGDFGEVLLMDWGLAKIQKREAEGKDDRRAPQIRKIESGRVDSFRSQVAAAQTRHGSVIGTPEYMPPEQAEGFINLIDERSDIYSLGAILYEILTLKRPIRGDTIEKILDNVSAGVIVPPEERTPERNIPKEISAIVMKAMNYNKHGRYASVEAFRHDVERYLEGHAVSAKEDSPWETVVKLVRRNRPASLVAGVMCLVLIAVMAVAFVVNLKARHEAEDARRQAEQLLKQNKTAQANWLNAVARRRELTSKLAVEARRVWHQVREENFVDSSWSERWRASCSWVPRELTESERAMFIKQDEDGLRVKGEDALFLTCSQSYPGDLRMIYEATWRDGREGGFHAVLGGDSWRTGYNFQLGGYANTKAAILRGDGSKTMILAETPFHLEKDRRYQIDVSFTQADKGRKLEMRVDGRLLLTATDPEPILIAPGKSFFTLMSNFDAESTYHWARLYVLSEPLRSDLLLTARRYLEKGKYATACDLYEQVVQASSDPERVAEAKNGLDRARQLMHYSGQFARWRKQLQTAWPNSRFKMELISDGLAIEAKDETIKDLEPLRNMPVTQLKLRNAPVTSLEPLHGKPMTLLDLWNSKVDSLEPLTGMPLEHLDLSGAYRISSLAPLKGMPLKTLTLNGCFKVTDLSVLKGFQLESLSLAYCQDIRDLSVISGMPLRTLNLSYCTGIRDFSMLADLPVQDLNLSGCTQFKALDVLKNMPLKSLNLSQCKAFETLDFLRGHKLLHLIINECSNLRDLDGIRGMDLGSLSIADCPKITDLSVLPTLKLILLNMSGCTGVQDFGILAKTRIQAIDLSHCSALRDLTPLRNLQIHKLRLDGCSGLASLDRLSTLPLRLLSIRDLPQVQSLSFLKGTMVTILIASGCENLTDIEALRDLPLIHVDLKNTPKLKDRDALKTKTLVPFKDLASDYQSFLNPKYMREQAKEYDQLRKTE